MQQTGLEQDSAGNVWQLTTLGELNAVQNDAVIRNHSSGMHITIIRDHE
jgi:hypothetical protein